MSSRQRTSNEKACLPAGTREGQIATESKRQHSEEAETLPMEESPRVGVELKRAMRRMAEADHPDTSYITHV